MPLINNQKSEQDHNRMLEIVEIATAVSFYPEFRAVQFTITAKHLCFRQVFVATEFYKATEKFHSNYGIRVKESLQ